LTSSSDEMAGPFSAVPSGPNWEPWQGQSQQRSKLFQCTWQPRCGQRAEHQSTWLPQVPAGRDVAQDDIAPVLGKTLSGKPAGQHPRRLHAERLRGHRIIGTIADGQGAARLVQTKLAEDSIVKIGMRLTLAHVVAASARVYRLQNLQTLVVRAQFIALATRGNAHHEVSDFERCEQLAYSRKPSRERQVFLPVLLPLNIEDVVLSVAWRRPAAAGRACRCRPCTCGTQSTSVPSTSMMIAASMGPLEVQTGVAMESA
jgi:hypothetical protein